MIIYGNNNCNKLEVQWAEPVSLTCGFRVEDFLEIDQLETRIAYGGHVC